MRASIPEQPQDDILCRAQKLPPFLQSLTVGVNTPENLGLAINQGDIRNPPDHGFQYLIPETVDTIITGFILVDGKTNSVSQIRPHPIGVGLGHTPKIATYQSGCTFVFQNPILALHFYLNIYILEGIVPPIIISPQMDFHRSWKWLPEKRFVLVVSDYSPERYRQLSVFDPKIVPEAAVQPYLYNTVELLLYKARSVPLNNQLFPSVAISARTSIVAGPHAWYFLPSSEMAVNATVRIDRVFVRKTAYNYIGRVVLGEKTVPFRVNSKKGFYEQIKIACDSESLPFYCAPSIRKSLPDIAIAMSPNVSIRKYSPRIKKRSVVLPNTVITPEKISYTGMAVPGEPGSKICYKVSPELAPRTQGQLNQLSVFFALCCALGRRIYYGRNVNVFVLGEFSPAWKDYFNGLSIKTSFSGKKNKSWWPIVHSKFQLDTVFSKGMNIYFGDTLQALVSMYLSPGILVGITEEMCPPYPEEQLQSALCSWIQFCLKHKTEWTNIRKRLSDYFGFYLDNFCRMFKIEEGEKNYLSLNIKKSIRRKKLEFVSAITYQLLQEGDFSKADLLRVDSRQYLVPVKKLNTALRNRGLAEIFWAGQEKTIRITCGPTSQCPLSVLLPVDASI